VLGEALAQREDIGLDERPGRLGGLLTPDHIDQPGRRDHPSALQQQRRQQATRLDPAQGDAAAIGLCIQRAQNPEIHDRAFPARRLAR
jgi:hypothetical protein